LYFRINKKERDEDLRRITIYEICSFSSSCVEKKDSFSIVFPQNLQHKWFYTCPKMQWRLKKILNVRLVIELFHPEGTSESTVNQTDTFKRLRRRRERMWKIWISG